MNFTILRFDTLGSTNTEAISQAKRGAGAGLCVVARRQTAGRGRHGRTWVSEMDAGLYLSVVVRPRLENKFLPLLTLMTAVAVSETLRENSGLAPDIKWANDVHINGKKISGILAEMTETAQGPAVIVGIGINLRSDAFPPELAEIATSIEAETQRPPDSAALLETLTGFFGYFYDMLEGEDGPRKIGAEWQKRSSYACGKKVRVRMENQTIVGETCGIEENGALRVKSGDTIRIIQAGDVETLRSAAVD